MPPPAPPLNTPLNSYIYTYAHADKNLHFRLLVICHLELASHVIIYTCRTISQPISKQIFIKFFEAYFSEQLKLLENLTLMQYIVIQFLGSHVLVV